uniref:Uncharacterized protein n=1 Tax=Arundo donax TaxID=35708 RepID=A0A0A9R7D5_ARUDO
MTVMVCHKGVLKWTVQMMMLLFHGYLLLISLMLSHWVTALLPRMVSMLITYAQSYRKSMTVIRIRIVHLWQIKLVWRVLMMTSVSKSDSILSAMQVSRGIEMSFLLLKNLKTSSY